MSKAADNLQDGLIVDLGKRIQIPDKRCQACLIKMIAKGQQIYQTGQFTRKCSCIVEQLGQLLNCGFYICPAVSGGDFGSWSWLQYMSGP